MEKVIIFTLTALFFLFVTTSARAQATWLDTPPGYLPSDGVKFLLEGIKENISLWITFDANQKAYKLLEQAEERLAEIEALATLKRYQYLNRATARYQKKLEKTELAIAKVKETSANSKELEEKLLNALIRHQAVLSEVSTRIPEENQEKFEALSQVIQNRYQELSEKVDEPTRARVSQQVQERIPDLGKYLPQRMKLRMTGLHGPNSNLSKKAKTGGE